MALIIASPGTTNFMDPDLMEPESVAFLVGPFTVDGVALAGGTTISIFGDDSIYDAGFLQDNLVGGYGRDTIVDAGGHENFLEGGAGADSLLAGWGDMDVLRGDSHLGGLFPAADGNDTLVDLGGTWNRLIGGDGDDWLNAGWGAWDSLYGGNGNDVLVDQGGGYNFLDGGPGNDSLVGGAAGLGSISGVGETMSGGEGNDTLRGSLGDDLLDGGAGIDRLIGGSGDDIYYVDAGDTVVEAIGAGMDTVVAFVSWTLGGGLEWLRLAGGAAIDGTGNAFANRVSGNSGANRLFGLAGHDTIDGGDGGNDTLDGGLGNDFMEGGGGDDVYIVDSINDIVREFHAGLNGHDLVIASVSYSLVAPTYHPREVEDLTLVGPAALNGTGNALANRILGNDAANRLDGGGGLDTLIGGSGNDTYVLDSLGDVVVEEADGGVDSIVSSVSYTLADTLEHLRLLAGKHGRGNAGNNMITGSATPALLEGLGGNDTLTGGENGDTLDGGTGADRMDGGQGGDLYIVDSVLDVVVERAGFLRDRVLASVSYTLGTEVEDLTLDGTDGISGIGNILANAMLGNAGANNLNGLAGSDTLVGAGGNDTLNGGSGADSLEGGEGDDLYVVDSGLDRVLELAGGGRDKILSTASTNLAAEVEDLALGGTAALNANGNVLANVMTGNGADNRLNGGGGDDTILGGSGHDSLDGGLGADSMVGGAGNDAYTVNFGLDRVVEFAGGGHDRVISTVSLNLQAEVEDLVLGGVLALNANGNALANAMTGNASANRIMAGLGNDTVLGGAGGDTLDGGAGNDSLAGDEGDDVLTGGLGFDTLAGGDAGVDRFRFGGPSLGFDHILDFAPEDLIEVSSSGFGGLLALGALSAAQFSDLGFAVGAVPQFIYVPATGVLRWDVDGVGGAASVPIAVLTGAPAISATDIVVIA